MKKIIALALSALFIFGLLTACGKDANPTDGSSDAKKEYTVGICNYVDDASLNQIVENIQARLEEIGKEKNVTFKIEYDNCNADANLMSQIIANFQADNVDLMVGVATPVAMAMQAATEDTKTPVVFSGEYDGRFCVLGRSLHCHGNGGCYTDHKVYIVRLKVCNYLRHKVCVRVAVIVFDFERDVLFLAYLFKARLNVFNYLVKGSVVNIVAYTDGVFFLCVGRAVRGVCVFAASGEKSEYKQRGERKCDYFFHFDLPAFFILDICNVKRSICDYINFSSARGAIFCIT